MSLNHATWHETDVNSASCWRNVRFCHVIIGVITAPQNVQYESCLILANLMWWFLCSSSHFLWLVSYVWMFLAPSDCLLCPHFSLFSIPQPSSCWLSPFIFQTSPFCCQEISKTFKRIENKENIIMNWKDNAYEIPIRLSFWYIYVFMCCFVGWWLVGWFAGSLVVLSCCLCFFTQDTHFTVLIPLIIILIN